VQTTHGKKYMPNHICQIRALILHMTTPVRTRRARGVVNLEPVTPAKLELPIDQDRRKSIKPIATPGMSTCIIAPMRPS